MLNTVYHKTNKWILFFFFRRAITLEKTFLRGSLVTTNPPAFILNSASVLKWLHAKTEKSAKRFGPSYCISWPMLTQLTTVCPVGCGLLCIKRGNTYIPSVWPTNIVALYMIDNLMNHAEKVPHETSVQKKWVSEPWVWKNEMTEHTDRLLKPERPPVDRGILCILYFTLLALCDAWSDVNVSPCDQQDREDLCLFGITNAYW